MIPYEAGFHPYETELKSYQLSSARFSAVGTGVWMSGGRSLGTVCRALLLTTCLTAMQLPLVLTERSASLASLLPAKQETRERRCRDVSQRRRDSVVVRTGKN